MDRREVQQNEHELILSEGDYAYTQDKTTGVVKTVNGPNVLSITGQERPVTYDHEAGRFEKCELQNAVKQCVVARQGQYIELINPCADGVKFIAKGEKTNSPELKTGCKINIPGPVTFALWPRQHARVIEGHQLRSNEYVVARVYDEEAARESWGDAIVKTTGESLAKETQETQSSFLDIQSDEIAVGTHFVIRGDRISFFIPHTGLEIVPEAPNKFIRQALTLERLQYCVLVDEDGNKRFEYGPKVVFPKPTENFLDVGGKQVFNPVELNEIQGLHIKVIADYKENGKEYKAGDEIFLTGKDTPIYFPRQEHSIVKYDGKSKHYATAIPKGEGRYVMDRKTGDIATVTGPKMLLPDPIHQVVVRRRLSDKECKIWYPGNSEALEYNRSLADIRTPTTRSAISDGEYNRNRARRGKGPKDISKSVQASALSSAAYLANSSDNASADILSQITGSNVHADTNIEAAAGEFVRGSTYTQPRTLTLDTKFAGVPTIRLWSGYAIQIVNKEGERRVELGPKSILLDYDETLEILKLSTGCPKQHDQPIETVYLRLRNNSINDRVSVETQDHIKLQLDVILRVDFEEEAQDKWFNVDNYIRLLTDRVRSLVAAYFRLKTLEQAYDNPAQQVRAALLGEKDENGQRAGYSFAENGMRLKDVEITDFRVCDGTISQILTNTERFAVQSRIEAQQLQNGVKQERDQQHAIQETERLKAETEKAKLTIQQVLLAAKTELAQATFESQKQELTRAKEIATERNAIEDFNTKALLAREAEQTEQRLKFDRAEAEILQTTALAETEAYVARVKAVEGQVADALIALGDKNLLGILAEKSSLQAHIGADTLTELIGKVVKDIPALAKTVEKLTKAKEVKTA